MALEHLHLNALTVPSHATEFCNAIRKKQLSFLPEGLGNADLIQYLRRSHHSGILFLDGHTLVGHAVIHRAKQVWTLVSFEVRPGFKGIDHTERVAEIILQEAWANRVTSVVLKLTPEEPDQQKLWELAYANSLKLSFYVRPRTEHGVTELQLCAL